MYDVRLKYEGFKNQFFFHPYSTIRLRFSRRELNSSNSMGKSIIVTGASRGMIGNPQSMGVFKTKIWYTIGIGLAVTKYLVQSNNNVVIISRSVNPLQQLKQSFPKQVEVLSGDVSDSSLAKKAVDLAVESFGTLDALVLNHGILGQVGKVADADPQQWKEGMDVNFISLVAFVRIYHAYVYIYNFCVADLEQVKAALPALRASRGKIIFTSSGAAISPYKGWGLYGASKAAMNHLALTLGAEEPDVTSVSVRPGMVDTEMQRELREDHSTTLEADMHGKFTTVYKEGKLLKPEQPGHVIAKLALDAPKSLSGRFIS